MRKNSKSIAVTRLNKTNSNSTGENKKKKIKQIIYYNCSKKNHFFKNVHNLKKMLKTSIGLSDLDMYN